MNKLTKREIIKNIAIVFLGIMLVLTFFSNTILNRTLPEVSTQNVTSGSVTTQVRGEGIVETEDPYNVVLDETRKVKGLKKHNGDHVEVGDILYTLEGESSEELTEAKNALLDAQAAYDTAILDSGLTNAEVAQVEAGVTANTSTILANLEAKDNVISQKQKKLEEIQMELDLAENSSEPDTSSEQKNVDKAQAEYDTALAVLNKYDAYIADYEAKTESYNTACTVFDYYVSQGKTAGDQEYDDALAAKNAAYDAMNIAHAFCPSTDDYNAAKKTVADKKKVLDEAIKKKNKKESSGSSNQSSLKNQKIKLEKELADLKSERDKYFSAEKTKIDLEKQYQGILKAKKKVEDLEKKAIGGEIKSPVAGTVDSMEFASGQKIEAGSTVAVVRLDGKGYKLSFPVDAKQAKSVKVGDDVTVVNSWFYGDINANLVAIQPDKSNARDGKLLVFSLSGDSVQAGQNLTLSVGKKSSEYESVVPLSALRGDNSSKFVLKVETKSTPFGSRYIARRVDVEVLAQDDKVAAVKGELNSWEYVITNASRELKSGDQVKLTE